MTMPKKHAGAFSTWRKHTLRTAHQLAHALQTGKGFDRVCSSVPCGHCNICCRWGYYTEVSYDQGDSPELETEVSPDGRTVLRQKENGECFYLVEGKCSVYAIRPLTCRNFDCRGMAYLQIPIGDPLLRQAVEQWDINGFSKTREDNVLLAAFVLAAKDIVARHPNIGAEILPGKALLNMDRYKKEGERMVREWKTDPQGFLLKMPGKTSG